MLQLLQVAAVMALVDNDMGSVRSSGRPGNNSAPLLTKGVFLAPDGLSLAYAGS